MQATKSTSIEYGKRGENKIFLAYIYAALDHELPEKGFYKYYARQSFLMTGLVDLIVMVAELMALAARTAPKARGSDSLYIRVITGTDLNRLSEEMRRLGDLYDLGFFARDAGNLEKSGACLQVGAKGGEVIGLDCGACGYSTCKEMLKAQKEVMAKRSQRTQMAQKTPESQGRQKTSEGIADKPFLGPNCAIKMADLGIALGSAAKTASLHNVDNRIMYTAGTAALSLGWMEGCTVAYGIPLSASGKNIYFDRQE